MNEFSPMCYAMPDLPEFDQLPAFITTGEHDPSIFEAHVHMHGVFAGPQLKHVLSWIRHATGRDSGNVPFWDRRAMTWDGGYELSEVH